MGMLIRVTLRSPSEGALYGTIRTVWFHDWMCWVLKCSRYDETDSLRGRYGSSNYHGLALPEGSHKMFPWWPCLLTPAFMCEFHVFTEITCVLTSKWYDATDSPLRQYGSSNNCGLVLPEGSPEMFPWWPHLLTPAFMCQSHLVKEITSSNV